MQTATNHNPTRRVPSPEGNILQLGRRIRQKGFLKFIEDTWREQGDFFLLKFGSRQMYVGLHPDVVRHVSITQRERYEKLHSYDPTRRFLLGKGLLTSTGDMWRQQRRLMAPFYTPRGVQAYAEIMLRDALRLAERWQPMADGNKVVEMGEEMTFVTAAIILKAMFSMETNEQIIRMKDAVETMIGYVSRQNQSALPVAPLWMPTPLNRAYRSARDQVHSYINGVIQQRRALPEDQWSDDLLTRLMQARDEETGTAMSEELLRDESITVFFAGHETTARTMTHAWYALSSHPQVLEKLQAELDAVLGDRVPTVEDLHRLPYTLQVIKETLRLYPPAPMYIRDAASPDEINGYPIPAGASVVLSPYFTHRHPDFWEQPEHFDPERWTPDREAAMHPQAYHPFAAGQRICLGNNFSLLETHILLAVLAKRFTPRLVDGFGAQWAMRGTLGTTNGMPMTITRR